MNLKIEYMSPKCQKLYQEVEILRAMLKSAMFNDQRLYYAQALKRAEDFFNQMYYGVKW
jgi:hypothetical protein